MDPALAGFLGGLAGGLTQRRRLSDHPLPGWRGQEAVGETYAMFADATDMYVAVCADLVEFQPESRLTRAETEELRQGSSSWRLRRVADIQLLNADGEVVACAVVDQP
jgi:hypothetical protein